MKRTAHSRGRRPGPGKRKATADSLPPAHDWRTTDEHEIERRRARAAEGKFDIRNLDPAHPIFSTFRVRSESGRDYSVEVRGTGSDEIACTCVDFRSNQLGTCKHAEALRLHLARRAASTWKEALAKGSTRLDVVLDPERKTLHLNRPGNAGVPAAIAEWFDDKGHLVSSRDQEEAVEPLRLHPLRYPPVPLQSRVLLPRRQGAPRRLPQPRPPSRAGEGRHAPPAQGGVRDPAPAAHRPQSVRGHDHPAAERLPGPRTLRPALESRPPRTTHRPRLAQTPDQARYRHQSRRRELHRASHARYSRAQEDRRRPGPRCHRLRDRDLHPLRPEGNGRTPSRPHVHPDRRRRIPIPVPSPIRRNQTRAATPRCRRLGPSVLQAMEHRPSGRATPVIVFVVDKRTERTESDLRDLAARHFPDPTSTSTAIESTPAKPRVEVLDRATHEAIQRLIEAGLLQPSHQFERHLLEGEPAAAPQRTPEELRRIETLRSGGRRALRMARVLAVGEFFAEARKPLAESALTWAQALALEDGLPHPESLPDLQHDDWDLRLPGRDGVVKALSGTDDGAAVVADALNTVVTWVEGRE